MFVIFYRSYPYAPSATLLSAVGNAFAFLMGVGGIVCFVMAKNNPVLMIILGILLIAAAVCCWYFLGRKIPDKISQSISEKNIRTKANYAAMYCRQHPEAYASLCAQNPDFAAKFMFNEKGKLVRRK